MPSRSTKITLEKATQEYQSQLTGSPGASHLLVRGITNETIERFRLGYVEVPLLGDERFVGRISIPYLTVSGVVQLRYRTTLEGWKPKYDQYKGEGTRPFNVSTIGSQETIYIVEGEIDAITLDQAGYSAIGIPGATNWSKVYRRILRHHSCVVLADGDKAGREFADRVSQDVRCKTIVFPDDEDVNSLYAKHPDYLMELITIE